VFFGNQSGKKRITGVYYVTYQIQAEQHCVRAFISRNNWLVGGILRDKLDCQTSLQFKLVRDLPLHQKALSRGIVHSTSKTNSSCSYVVILIPFLK